MVRSIALDLAQVVAASPDTLRTNFDWVEPTREVRIRVDQDEARLLGLSSEALAGVLNTVITGTPVTQVRDDIYLVNVLARATDEQRVSLTTLPTLQVPLPNGRTVPLSQFASFEFTQDFPLIWRRDRVPTLTVQADVAPGQLPAAVVAGLEDGIEQLRQGLPQGYDDRGRRHGRGECLLAGLGRGRGADHAADHAHRADVRAARASACLFIVLSVAPLGLIGVVAALLPSGQPLGFVAILGCLALLGMITKNAVILVGQIEAERAAGQERVRRRARGRRHPLPPDHADRALDRVRHDPDRAHRVLGADGVRDHGRPARRHPVDAGVPAGALRGLVRRRPGACAGRGDRRRRQRLDDWEEEGREMLLGNWRGCSPPAASSPWPRSGAATAQQATSENPLIDERFAFETADTDGDGVVSLPELGRDAAHGFATLDKDGDGKLKPAISPSTTRPCSARSTPMATACSPSPR